MITCNATPETIKVSDKEKAGIASKQLLLYGGVR